MNKTCVFIIGTNCSGKSTLVKELIRRFGGVLSSDKWITEVKNGCFCIAGKYTAGSRYGGIDGWGEVKPLQSVVERAFKTHDVIICEGVKLHSVGPALSNALYVANNRLVCFLYAPAEILNQRLNERSGGQISLAILKDQQACARSLNRWAKIGGVSVMHCNTSVMSVEECADALIDRINKLSKN